MLRISALNDSSDLEDDQIETQLTKTKEAKEAEAFAAYNKALSHQHKGNILHAEKLLRNLFDHPLLKEAAGLVADDTQLQNKNHSGLQLLYSIHKNLASILLQRNELREAMAAYIEAVQIDSTEVTVWFQMGQVARKLENYPLAKICFQQALQCNSHHWPSLDNAITVTYALGDYLLCLQNISLALEKDCGYSKGLALRKEIYQEQPSLEKFTKELFLYCAPSINTTQVEKEEKQEYIEEALKIRSCRRQLAAEEKEKEMKSVTFLNPLTPFNWKNVGEQLIALYDFVTTSVPPKSLALEVDLRDYFFLDQSVFFRQYDEENNLSTETNKKDSVDQVSNKTSQQSSLSDKSTPPLKAVEPLAIINSVKSTKETALLKRLQGDENMHSPGVIKKTRLDVTAVRDCGLKDLDSMDVTETFEMPLLRDVDIEALNLTDISRNEFKPELLLKDDDIVETTDTADMKSLENVLASVIDMEFEVQNSDKLVTDVDRSKRSTQTVQDLELTLKNTTVNSNVKELFDIQQTDLENQELVPKTSGDSCLVSSPTKTFLPVANIIHSPVPPEASVTGNICLIQNHNNEISPAEQMANIVQDNITLKHSQVSAPNVFEAFQKVSTNDIKTSQTLAHIASDQSSKSVDFPANKDNLLVSDQPINISCDSLNLSQLCSTPIYKPDVSPVDAGSANLPLDISSQRNLMSSNDEEKHLDISLVETLPLETSRQSNTKKDVDADLALNTSLVESSQIDTFTQCNKRTDVDTPKRCDISQCETLAADKSPSSMLSSVKLKIYPTDLAHSPITTSLLSPDSVTYPKSASAYHNVLSTLKHTEAVVADKSLGCSLTKSIQSKGSKSPNKSDQPSEENYERMPLDFTNKKTPVEPRIGVDSLSTITSVEAIHENQTDISQTNKVRSQAPLQGDVLTNTREREADSPNLVPGMTSPNQQFSLSSPLFHPLLNPSKHLKDAAAHFESFRTSANMSLYHDGYKSSAVTSTAGNTSQYHQHSPKSPSNSQSESRYPQLASAQLQSLARISQTPPSPTSNIVSYQAGDHSYQKKGLLFQVMMESNPSVPVISSSRSTSSQSVSHRKTNTNDSASSTPVQRAVKRGSKRKMDDSLLDEWAYAEKRRSTRSRNPKNQREGKSINYKNVMKSYFPASFLKVNLQNNVETSDELTMEVDKAQAEPGLNVSTMTLKKLVDNEEDDVKMFIRSCLKCNGVIDLMYKYLLQLANKSDYVWYESIAEIYLKLYKRLRKHFSLPTVFDDAESLSLEGYRNYAAVILVWCELNLNQAVLDSSLRSLMSPSKASQFAENLIKLLGEYHSYDMAFLASLIGRNDALGSWLGHFSVRFYWLKAKEHQFLNETLDAVDCYEIAREFLQDVEKECSNKDEVNTGVIILPNLQDKLISSNEARRQLEALQRSKSLEDNKKLFDEAQFDRVVENLVVTFSNQTSKKVLSLVERERPSQLLLLVNSLYHLNKPMEGIQWAEASFNEAVLYYKRVPSVQLHQEWAATLVSLFACIDRLLEEDSNILSSLSRSCLYRLADNLTSVIDICLDVAETVTEMPIASLLPWKILYRVLHYEEQLNAKSCESKEKENETDEDEEEEMSRSLVMLIEAHDHLGRHAWCTRDNGLLLLFTMSVLDSKDLEDKDREDIHFEQCVYCLYGHPNKKGRARHLTDHNVSPISLTWDRAGSLFLYFAPKQVPEFDSYKIKSVTSDVENLLRRIDMLVPDELNPAQHVSAITDYIEGISNTAPCTPLIKIQQHKDPYKMCNQVYYLLGDFYFKNKEPAKAVKFYQLDLVLNSNRMDSWAGLALAKMYQIEQKLNSTELKIEAPIYKKSEAALRCFRRAVELQKGSRKLWLEYGSLAYQLHTHASRQSKYKDLLSIGAEVIMNSISHQEKSLLLAKQNYLQARECQGDGTEEDWLTHYMLGKIAEKEKESPEVYLEHYKQAAICLHNEEAVYPKKIQFASIPPHLALEALEVFYRLHVSALKLVLYSPSNEHLQLIDKYVQESLQSPFAKCDEKQKSMEQDRDGSAQPKLTANQMVAKQKQIYHKNPLDHDYSKHKSATDSQSDVEETKRQPLAPPPTQVVHLDDLEMRERENLSSYASLPELAQVKVPESSQQEQVSVTNDDFHTPNTKSYPVNEAIITKPVMLTCDSEVNGDMRNHSVDIMQPSGDNGNKCEQSGSQVDISYGVLQGTQRNLSNNHKILCDSRDTQKNSQSLMSAQLNETEQNKSETSSGDASSSLASNQSLPTVSEAVPPEIPTAYSDITKQAVDSNTTNSTLKMDGAGDRKTEEIRVVQSPGNKMVVNDEDVCNKEEKEMTTEDMNVNSTAEKEDNVDVSIKQDKDINIEKRSQEEKELTHIGHVEMGLEEKIGAKDVNIRNEENKEMTNNDVREDEDEKIVTSRDCNMKNEEENKWINNEKVEKSNSLSDMETSVLEERKSEEVADENICTDINVKLAAQSRESINDKEISDVLREQSQKPEVMNNTKESEKERKEPFFLRAEILTKCIRGLELCAERYSAHYKSLYRLADIYYFSKNLQKARDILLGRPDWLDQSHMPAPGLFAERKLSNFFQGLWKIPIEDIDRSGCFASHVHRSVVLLLKVLADLGDLEMLKYIRTQLKRTPDIGKKYLRDAERLALADEVIVKCIEVVNKEMDANDRWSENQREDNLANVYQVWLMAKGSNVLKKATTALHRAFKTMMKGRTDVNRLTEEQAIFYCQKNLLKVTQSPVPVNPQGKMTADQTKVAAEKSKSTQLAPLSLMNNVKENLNVKIKDQADRNIPQSEAVVQITREDKIDSLAVNSSERLQEISKPNRDELISEAANDVNTNVSHVCNTTSSITGPHASESVQFTSLKNVAITCQGEKETKEVSTSQQPCTIQDSNKLAVPGKSDKDKVETMVINLIEESDVQHEVTEVASSPNFTQILDDDEEDVIIISESD
uniref:Calcineurin-binding protein cabin-1 n=1 Tax=Biomphalaria glabrata TaxID=6526 RepID=A0A2C9JR21_BIOGL